MGLIHEEHGRISIETRSESFIIHPFYGYDESGHEYDDSLGSFGKNWREGAHPEFLLEDLPDLISALKEIHLKSKGPAVDDQNINKNIDLDESCPNDWCVRKRGHGGPCLS